MVLKPLLVFEWKEKKKKKKKRALQNTVQTVTYTCGDNYKTKRNCVYVTSYTKLAEICLNLRYMSWHFLCGCIHSVCLCEFVSSLLQYNYTSSQMVTKVS